MMTEQLQLNKLASYIDALRPIIYVPTFDFHAFDAIIEQLSNESKDNSVYEYNEGLGVVDFKTKKRSLGLTLDRFLRSYALPPKGTNYLVLKDVHSSISNPVIISLLKSIALRNQYDPDYNVTIFIVSSVLTIPPELEKLITIFDPPLPSKDGIKDLIINFAKANKFNIDETFSEELTWSLKGFSEFEITQILNLAYQNSGTIEAGDLSLIIEEKEQIIAKSGVLEILKLDDSIDDVGGLDRMKDWLRKKSQVLDRLNEAVKYGVDIPKGLMIVGMPGCGKSLTAKATAKLFGVPLIRLDVGKLLGKYVGESESNMRRAISIAEAISPCVLWVDEIEKAFSGIGQSGGSHEVTTRLFGFFLTWLQEKDNTVFVVATSNDISCLPPEFLRKGRFDEIFLVDFPNADERKSIFEIHLKKRGKWSTDIDVVQLLKKTEGFSGADIESVVKNTIENAFLSGEKSIGTEDLIQEIKDTKPISESLQEKIRDLRKSLERIDVKKASYE